MIIINDKNKKFVKKHIPNADKILNSDSARDALEAFSDWLDMNPDCWDENGYDYSDLGRQAQKYCTIMFMLINQMHKIVLYRILIKNVKLHH